MKLGTRLGLEYGTQPGKYIPPPPPGAPKLAIEPYSKLWLLIEGGDIPVTSNQAYGLLMTFEV